jgi:hypothetical protein
MNHFIPTDFDTTARTVLTLPFAESGRLNDPTVVPVRASNPLVEVGLVTADRKGTALPCINWAGRPLVGFNVTLLADISFKTAALSSGRKLVVAADKRTFTFDLAITADVLVLR